MTDPMRVGVAGVCSGRLDGCGNCSLRRGFGVDDGSVKKYSAIALSDAVRACLLGLLLGSSGRLIGHCALLASVANVGADPQHAFSLLGIKCLSVTHHPPLTGAERSPRSWSDSARVGRREAPRGVNAQTG